MNNTVLQKNDRPHATDSSEPVIPSELKNSFKSIQKSTMRSWGYAVYEVPNDSNSASFTYIKRNNLIGKIISFKNLDHGWNGYNGLPINDTIIKKSVQLLKSLDYLPEVFPTGRNSIQFEFSNKRGDYLEFEIFEDKIIAYKEVDEGEDESIVEKDEILSIISDFYA